MYKILFVSQNILDRRLGASKALMEIHDVFQKDNWDSHIIGPKEVKEYLLEKNLPVKDTYYDNLIVYLKNESKNYHIIDIDQKVFPIDRTIFPYDVLFVIRSALFFLHFTYIKIEKSRKLLHVLNRIKKCIIDEIKLLYTDIQPKKHLNEYKYESADYINVLNSRDKKALELLGIDAKTVFVFPTGIDKTRRNMFDEMAQMKRNENNIVFVGTFDYRKGCMDIVKIFKYIKSKAKDAQLSLLGAQGIFNSPKKILNYFPRYLHSSINIVMKYDPDHLPFLLKDQTVGIFPSYIEGFPFSPTEKMAAGVPVFAYDVPGPCDGIPQEYLIRRGDWLDMAEKVVLFLNNKDNWQKQRLKVWQHSQRYDWDIIARETSTVYKGIIKGSKEQ